MKPIKILEGMINDGASGPWLAGEVGPHAEMKTQKIIVSSPIVFENSFMLFPFLR